MKKDFTVSKIEAPDDGSPYVFVTFTDRNEPRSSAYSGEAIPFTSPEDIMKNLPKVMSNMYDAGGGIPANSPTFKITVKEYEDMAIKVGDRVGMEINKVDSGGV
jgi:hypothetical protein